MKSIKNLVGISEIKTTLQQGLFSFRSIELDDHSINVTTKILTVNNKCYNN